MKSVCEDIVKATRDKKDEDESTFDKTEVSGKTEVATLSSLDDALQLRKEDVLTKNQAKIDSVATSKITKMVIRVFQTRVSRGSSWIATPEEYANAKCGLINIKNYDQTCFYWCAKYHASTKENNCDRLTVFNKLEDIYNYDNVQFPASFGDINIFEINNKFGVIVFGFDNDNIVREYHGNKDNLLNDTINLLRTENEKRRIISILSILQNCLIKYSC